MRSKGGLKGETRNSELWQNNLTGVRNVLDPETKRLNSFSGYERNKLYWNSGGKEFFDVSSLSGADSVCDSRSFGTLDFNRDGLQDIALINTNVPHFELLRNNLSSTRYSENGYLAIRFVGGNQSAQSTKEWTCRDGIGAVAHVKTCLLYTSPSPRDRG